MTTGGEPASGPRRRWAIVACVSAAVVAVSVAVVVAEPRAPLKPVTASAPDRIGQWRKLVDATSLSAVERYASRFESLPEGAIGGSVAVGIYRRGADLAAFAAYPAGTDDLGEVAFHPERVTPRVLELSGGTGTYRTIDPLDEGGAVSCTAEGGRPGAILCAWAGAGTIGQITFEVAGLHLDEVAPLVASFRAAAASGDEGTTGVQASAGGV